MVYPTISQDSSVARKPVTLHRLAAMHDSGEKIAMLTCYDASFAALLDRCEIDVMLVGDSLGMVLQGHDSTLPVTVADIAYHVACVARGKRWSWLIADLPFASYHASPAQAMLNAGIVMQAGAQMVKIEGGQWLAPTIEFLVERGIPVCAHLGLTPQSVHALGGYRVQGRSELAAQALIRDAHAVQDAGAQMLVLEMVPAPLAARITEELSIPTIGIGAGAQCSGQVLVLHDMLGAYPGKAARFVKNFLEGQPGIDAAVSAYRHAVKTGTFPATEHAFES